MANEKYQPKIGFYSRRKRRNKLLGRIMIFFLVAFLIYYVACHQETLGHDCRYIWYAILGPTLIGSILLGRYMRETIEYDVRTTKKNRDKAVISVAYLLLIIVSAMIMGFIAGYITWDRINKSIAQKSNAEEFYCNVDGFWHGRQRYNVNFKFAGKGEEFEISRGRYRQYSDNDPSPYRLRITARKGVGNYYVVDNWQIEKREK